MGCQGNSLVEFDDWLDLRLGCRRLVCKPSTSERGELERFCDVSMEDLERNSLIETSKESWD